MFRIPALFLILISLTGTLEGQIQRSNVYLFDMKRVNDTAFQFSHPRWLTFYNRNGYNNHPAFIDDNTLYVSSQMPYQDEPDIFALNLRDTTRTRITATKEGEFSPALMPDFVNFSAVRREVAGDNPVMRLWQFPVNRRFADNGKPVFKYITNVGYYYWISSQQVALYLVQEPSVLGIASLQTDQVTTIATNVGRTFRTISGGRLLFLQKDNSQPWRLMEWNPYARSTTAGGDNNGITPVVDALPGSEDFAVLDDGTILMASGSKLYKFNRLRGDTYWVEIADFSYYDVGNISRITVNRDGKIAFVGN